ncbi:TIGR02679 family protein [Comamonas composti]|uniref:TIGR02679 family protein n=1 Tax=Comamonas composti TaxID=408558 RepID=UPI0004166084|nr:TIGR02679 family protein [Comamonas composti]
MTMTSDIDPKLERRLGGSELSALRRRLRRHFERHGDNPEKRVLQLTGLSPAEHEALALIVGLPSRFTSSVRIDIAQFDAALRNAEISGSLREALERIDGPLVHQTAVKEELRARWVATFETSALLPALSAWLQITSARNLIKRLARQDPDTAIKLLKQVGAVLQRLPAAGLTRAQLAADVLGNAHALDGGQPTATLVLAVLRHDAKDAGQEQELPEDVVDAENISRPTERMRDTWAQAGILVNELARPVLFLNLPVDRGSVPPAALGEPGYLSLRHLLRTPITWSVAGQIVYICENPNIVSIAADRLGSACAPLVCTDGMPAAAQRVLLKQLADAGAKLLYHGDFDWAGIHIANNVMRLCTATPWRFQSNDYSQAFGLCPKKDRDLLGITVTASWDAGLGDTMQLHGLAIPEEAVVSLLIDDLRSSGR